MPRQVYRRTRCGRKIHSTRIRTPLRRKLQLCVYLLTSAGFLTCPLALARDSGGYIGASIGYSNLNGTVNDINSFTGIANPSETTLTTEGSSYSVFGGFRFNRFFALEGGLERLGSYDYHIGARRATPCFGCVTIAYPPGDFNTPVNLAKVQARGSWPLNDNWSLDLAAGVAMSPMKSDDPFLAASDYAGMGTFFSTFNLLMNAGASLRVSGHWWTRLEFSYLAAADGPPLGTGDVQTIRLSAEYRFFRD